MAETTKPNSDVVTKESGLVEKLALIIGGLPTFKKRGYNEGLKFNFISVEQMKKEIIPRCAELGIIMYPKAVDRQLNYRDRINREGEVYGLATEAQLTMIWVITDGKESIEVESVGEALDTSDKAVSKASTIGQKNLLKTVFGVTEDNEDNDGNTPVPQGESTRRAPQKQPAKKRQLTPEQKEFLGLKEQAIEGVLKLGRIKEVDPDQVVIGLVDEGYIPAEFKDRRHIKHRVDAQQLIDAVEKYIADNSLEAAQ